MVNNMNDGLIDKLRAITEEENLDTILKSSIGGYTKKSVQEYLAFIKTQQQNLSNAYTSELERIQSEKDALSIKLKDIQQQISNTEIEYKEQYENKIRQLQDEKQLLEKDMDEAIAKIHDDEKRIRAITETEAQCAELTSENNILSANLEMIKKELELRERESKAKDIRIDTLSRQVSENHSLLEKLQENLAELSEQNECLESENNELSEKLKEQFDQCVLQAKEISRIKVSNAILQRKLKLDDIGMAGGNEYEHDVLSLS